MKKLALILLMLGGLALPAAAQCTPTGILQADDFCYDGQRRFFTNIFSGTTYNWSVPGTSWSKTTTTNNVTIVTGELPLGTYTMYVSTSCGTACSPGSGTATGSFTVNCIFPYKKAPEEAREPIEIFDSLDLARLLADEHLYRIWDNNPTESLELANTDLVMDTFYVVTVNDQRQLATNLITLDAGETRTIPLNEDALEIYVISAREFIIFTGDYEWTGQKDERIINR